MRIGIIGAGPIGASISRKLVEVGHDVKIADARDIGRLEGKDIAGTPASAEEVIKEIDVLFLSLPLHAIPGIRHLTDQVGEEVIVADTSNYYPFRDNKIEEIESGMVESLWVSNQLGRHVIKAFSNLLAHTLENKGTHEGASGRIAMAVSGDDPSQKQKIMSLVNEAGFDAVDSGSLSDSWKLQPGTPAYCTELTKEEMAEALKKAEKDKAPVLRDKVMEKFSASMTHEDIVRINRETYNS